ncbi:MAG: threonine--tRNA ligase [Patescibacteria group bacterium]|nr:threonine--tRNA ligase [Patescibacteria group bacterium]
MAQKLHKIRHSLSHIMAMAVKELFPEAKLAIGPVIEDGFYYDFEVSQNFTPEDLPKIEKKMKKIIKQNISFEKIEIPYEKAKKKVSDQPYKKELLEEITKKGEKITFYKSSSFTDLCAGPHVKLSKEIKADAFKLTKVAGAYWRGDEKNKMLQRIYGVAFTTKKELAKYLKQKKEARKRDHRKLGQELELFAFHEVSPGAPFWLPKGMIIFRELEKLWRQIHDQAGYQETSTPILNHKSLWVKSGHWQHYKDNMFNLKIDDEIYSLKPMNCPGSTYIYNTKKRSYRDLPLRYSEIGRLHRNEVKGALGGLFRVRQITMDDAHIYCLKKQIQSEIGRLLKLIKKFYKIFGFSPNFVLATRPEKFMGETEDWDQAEKDLKKALENNKIDYQLSKKDGAFYGPKIDIHIDDTLGRTWQMATIQLDFQIPKRFNLVYTDKKGLEKVVTLIHRAIFGSFERFFGILVEHYAGAFPIWLSPVQIQIVPVGSSHISFSKKLAQKFKDENIRVDVDTANETVGNKIRKAIKQKVPYMLVIGDKEMNSDKLSVRIRSEKDLWNVKKEDFIKKVQDKITNRIVKLK